MPEPGPFAAVSPLARGKATGGFYGVRYLISVAVATITLAVIAWIVQDRQLALAAGVMGLYALHLISIRYILDNQQQHSLALQSQWELLQRLVDPNEPVDKIIADASADELADVARRGASVRQLELLDPKPRRHAGGNSHDRWDPESGSSSWPPIGLPLSTIDALRDLAIPAGLGVPEASDDRHGEIPTDPVRAPSGDPFLVSEIPIPRHFALGTVALIRQLLTPAEVARVLMEQRKQPDKRFATLAVEMGLLEDSQREELLLAQQEGLFTEDEMRQARERLREFRESTARALSDVD